MKTELKAKFIQHLNYKQNDRGFTLVELLVVVIIIGILAAIALPNFLNQSAKAKQTEARQNIGMINRVQNVYRFQNDVFASTFDLLAIGTLQGNTGNTSTTNYSYVLLAGNETTSTSGQAIDPGLRGYIGGTGRYTNTTTQSVIATVVCEAIVPGIAAPGALVTSATAAPSCPAAGYRLLGG
jgi:type IV pilus assembly protein PilA